MTNQNPEMRRDMLLRRALVPKGYRPTKNSDIEKMLNTIDDAPIDHDKKARMLRKINSQEPMFQRPAKPIFTVDTKLTEQEREMVALHRAQNKPLPPDLAAKVKAMEQRTSAKSDPGEETAGD